MTLNTYLSERSAFAVAILTLAFAGCGGGGGGDSTTFTDATGRGNCGGHELLVGDRANPRLTIRNKSEHRWTTTWLWFQGDSDFRIESVGMNGQAADDTFRSAGQWAVGGLGPGRTGHIRISLTAKKPGAPKVEIAFWGSSKPGTDGAGSIPDTPYELTCEYAIHP
jgi:hypothetical protein